jgi:hypothetical protein
MKILGYDKLVQKLQG